MSLLTKLVGVARGALSSVAKIPGVGAVMKVIPGLGTAATAMTIYQGIKGIGQAAGTIISENPAATGAIVGGAAGTLAGLSLAHPSGAAGQPGALAGIATGGGMGMPRGMRGIVRSATSYARKYPQWAMSVGGTAGIAQMIASGQLPMMRRRRGKGITSRDLRSFKRVARLVSHFSRPVHHMRGYSRAKH